MEVASSQATSCSSTAALQPPPTAAGLGDGEAVTVADVVIVTVGLADGGADGEADVVTDAVTETVGLADGEADGEAVTVRVAVAVAVLEGTAFARRASATLVACLPKNAQDGMSEVTERVARTTAPPRTCRFPVIG